MITHFSRILLVAGLFLSIFGAAAQDNIMIVDAGKKGIPVQETMYGLFFEDINFAADEVCTRRR